MIYGVQSRSLDYLGSTREMNFYGWRDGVILGNDINGGRMFIAQTYLDK